MPLLMCPNCQTGMKEITRESVLIDMCPTCHGVWLDRGELQKLLEVNQRELNAAYEPVRQPQQQTYQADYKHHNPYHGKHRKKSSLESLFDIFD